VTEERKPTELTLTPREIVPERTDRPAVEIKATIEREDLVTLAGFARSIGAADALPIAASAIAVNEVMRLKCQIPTCWGFNSSPFCPPHTATAEETRSVLADYTWALLLSIPRPGNGGESYPELIDHVNGVKEIVGRTEVEAQYSGFLDAMGFTGGPCTLCGMFSDEWTREMRRGNEAPSCPLMSEDFRLCLHFYHGRPTAQAVGMDMYLTAKNVGWEQHLQAPPPVTKGPMDWPCLPGVYPVLVK
jgi:predicted metal-binding protein